MGISRQIGWGAKENLLYGISRQVEQLTKVFSRVSISPPTPPPIVYTLALTFDDITNASLMIGGDAANVNDWNTFFDLPTYGTPFTSVNVNSNTINLIGGNNIQLKNHLFDTNFNDSLLGIIDTNCIISVGSWAFGWYTEGTFGCINLSTVILPELQSIEESAFYHCTSLINFNALKLTNIGILAFQHCTSLFTLNLPLVLHLPTSVFYECYSLSSINLPMLISCSDDVFSDCNLHVINIPTCIDLGGTVGYNYVFTNTTGNTITLTVPAVLMTCNGGQPDGDIQYLVANNTVTIITV